MASSPSLPSTVAPAPLSFLCLPQELCFKIICLFDWNSLGNACCASREIRSLAHCLTRQPYWVTHVEDQPPLLIEDFQTAADLERACELWVESLFTGVRGRPPPHLCLLFVSPAAPPNLPALLRVLRAKLPGCCTLGGLVGHGVSGRHTSSCQVLDLGSSEAPALAVSLVRLPAGAAVHAGLFQGSEGTGQLPHPASLGMNRTWIVLGGEEQRLVEQRLAALGQQYRGSKFMGGVGGGRDGGPCLVAGLPRQRPGQQLSAELTTGTLCICMDSAHIMAEVVPIRGLRCFSASHIITDVDCSMAPGQGPVSIIRQMSHVMPVRSKVLPLQYVPVGPPITPTNALVTALHSHQGDVPQQLPIFLGVAPPSEAMLEGWMDPQDTIMLQLHDPDGLMRTSGALPVQHALQPHTLAAFFRPDPSISQEQLTERLNLIAEEIYPEAVEVEVGGGGWGAAPEDDSGGSHDPSPGIGGGGGPRPGGLRVSGGQPLPREIAVQQDQLQAVYGALSFVCAARGQALYGRARVEEEAVAAAFPGIQMCGVVCNGEVGPIPGDEGVGPQTLPAQLLGFTTVVGVLRLSPAP